MQNLAEKAIVEYNKILNDDDNSNKFSFYNKENELCYRWVKLTQREYDALSAMRAVLLPNFGKEYVNEDKIT
jgi:hypothetical protein